MNDLEREAIGKAIGYALAAYDQTVSRGGQLDRINDTGSVLCDLLDDERVSDEVADVLSGMLAGLTTYMREVMKDKAGIAQGDGKLL